ncbi:uncharacterized protein NDAI_0G02710 [Naumovozyma dairenensis CBS 421]|uniref:Uncharacterized protein n=1 Tax=Naumovozyma dairenensis (strain ATCC 10597 / BCRC 20456 / CBS 421 / NBRC 0211 / NRRL Y-12639) TaxID=1071378 RepID=G0WE37_NAUDC|nr:hypothetical protein NDAI_0G02710 [Naumovozyma dairenensis CBS 421]CCD26048.2 hypothetical protein NDAI_0G02710 [Naumovozyma dairenensis CBS 421]
MRKINTAKKKGFKCFVRGILSSSTRRKSFLLRRLSSNKSALYFIFFIWKRTGVCLEEMAFGIYPPHRVRWCVGGVSQRGNIGTVASTHTPHLGRVFWPLDSRFGLILSTTVRREQNIIERYAIFSATFPYMHKQNPQKVRKKEMTSGISV